MATGTPGAWPGPHLAVPGKRAAWRLATSACPLADAVSHIRGENCRASRWPNSPDELRFRTFSRLMARFAESAGRVHRHIHVITHRRG
jgi:hypothetical protein